MEQTNEAQERCYALVATYLRQSFGDLAVPTPDGPTSFSIGISRHPIYVTVSEMGDDDVEDVENELRMRFG